MDQEPYLWDSVAAVSRSALGLRYQLLPYLYTQFFNAHSDGALVAQPLWNAFPSDRNTHAIDEQFLLGPNILVSPALYEGQLTVQAYFPSDPQSLSAVWYALGEDGESQGRPDYVVSSGGTGTSVVLSTPLSAFNVHVKSGAVLPLHSASDPTTGAAPLTTTTARALPFDLLVALDFNADGGGTAAGSLFWDDGEQVDLEQNLQVMFAASSSSVTASVLEADYVPDDPKATAYGKVTVMGLKTEPVAAKVVAAGADGGSPVDVPFTVTALTGSSGGSAISAEFDLSGASALLNQDFALTWTNE